jgi:hypothetical protein
MFRQTPSGPTFTQTPLLCVPEDEPEPDWAGVVAGAALAGAGAGAEVAGGLCFDVSRSLRSADRRCTTVMPSSR